MNEPAWLDPSWRVAWLPRHDTAPPASAWREWLGRHLPDWHIDAGHPVYIRPRRNTLEVLLFGSCRVGRETAEWINQPGGLQVDHAEQVVYPYVLVLTYTGERRGRF